MNSQRPARLLAILLTLSLLPCSSCRRPPQFGCDFEGDGAPDEFTWQCRTLYRLSAKHATSGSKSLEITFHPAPPGERENYPGLAFTKFDQDWSGHRAIALDAYNPETAPVALVLRLDDSEDPDYADRFNQSFLLVPGPNHISIPFSDLMTSGTRRALDFRGIQDIILFMANPKERHTLYLDRIRLE